MPLHLLGKKSWNVYNAENIARVQRDEAAARAREEAQEQRMQEHDAKVRLALLRGETPPPPPPEEEDEQQVQGTNRKASSSSRRDAGAGGRKRKHAGEDDTDFEMRVARERADLGDRVARELGGDDKRKSSSREITLVDSAGHISLFEPPPEDNRRKQKNPEYERKVAQKKLEQEDQYRMRLVNAAGKNGLGLTDGGPWYAAPDGDSTSALVAPSKDVFGRDDPGRKAREAARLDTSDPLAMMKMGAAKVRQLDKERKRVNDEREEELRALRKEERRREKEKERMRRREKEDGARRRDGRDGRERSRQDDLGRDRHSRSDRRSHSRHRSRDRERNRDRSRERSHERRRSREREHDRRHRGNDDDNHRRRHHDHDRSRTGEESRHRHKRHEKERDDDRR